MRTGGTVIDASRELQQLSHFGKRGLELLFELAGQELRRFPVLLDGRRGWTEDDVWEWTQEFFAVKGPVVTAGVLAQTHDDVSMGRYVRRAVRHFLVDQARKTPRGAVRRKIEELLAATPEFTRVPERTPGAPADGSWPATLSRRSAVTCSRWSPRRTAAASSQPLRTRRRRSHRPTRRSSRGLCVQFPVAGGQLRSGQGDRLPASVPDPDGIGRGLCAEACFETFDAATQRVGP